MTPITIVENSSRLERTIRILSKYIYIAIFFLFSVVISLFLLKIFGKTFNKILIYITFGSLIAALLLALIGIIFSLIVPILTLLRFPKYAFALLKCELSHDARYAQILAEFPSNVLNQVRQQITFRIERISGRINYVFGSGDKLALFGIAAIAWELRKASTEVGTGWQQDVFTICIAFFAGLALGAALLDAVRRRYLYHCQLIDLALTKQKNQIPLSPIARAEICSHLDSRTSSCETLIEDW